MILTPKQYQAAQYLADRETTELLFGGAAGGGKSAFGAIFLIDRCTKFPGTRWLMGRSKLSTLKGTTLKTFFEVCKAYKIDRSLYNYNQQDKVIKFFNDSEIILKDLFFYPSDPEFDELGSLEITGGFIDEANQVTVKARNIVKSRMRFKLKENNLIPKLLMTCNPAKNWTYTDFYKPYRDGTLPNHRKFIQALLSDNPHISEHYRANLLGLDEVSRMRLLEGEWEYDDDPAKLIEFDAIVDLWNNKHVDSGEKYITADIARLGSDKAVIVVWDGYIVKEIQSFPKSRLNEIGDVLRLLQGSYKIPNRNVIVDEDGVGGGVVDFMKVRGFVNNSSALNGDNYANLKSQCYYKLAELVNESRIYIDTDKYRDEIIEELEQVKSYKIDADTKLRIMPKDKVKEVLGRSPDFSDALMMRMFFKLQPVKKIYHKVL